MLTSGQLLAERYRLDRRIAVGGMGEVWQAVDVRLDRTVAVKVLKPELCGDAEFLHRFRTEARTTASLNHPGIAAVHDYGETASAPDGPEDTAYLVMELVEGEPLAAILAREGRVTVEHTLEMLEQAGNALHAAHERGLVHRDVKPGNILVTPTGTIKITDFGIAKAADAAPVTRSGMVMGTAHYIAPEQALGGDATPSSDVYSLAVVGYECLKGHRPFLSDNAVTVAMMHIREIPPPLPPDVPPGARALIEATLVKDPRRRYGGGGEFASAVAGVRAGRPLPTPAALTIPPQPQPQPQLQPQPQPQSTGASTSGVHRLPSPAAVPPPGSPPVNPVPPGSAPNGPQPVNGFQSGHTHPPGVIPPQPSATPQTPGARVPPAQAPVSPPAGGRFPPQDHRSRAGLWVFLVVFVVVVLIISGVAIWQVMVRSSPLPESAAADRPESVQTRNRAPGVNPGVRLVGSNSQEGVNETILRHPGVRHQRTAVPDAARASKTAGARHRTSDMPPARHRVHAHGRETYGKEVGGTAHRALVRRTSAVTGPRVGMMGRPWTRIGTTQR